MINEYNVKIGRDMDSMPIHAIIHISEVFIPEGATIPTVKVTLWDNVKCRNIRVGYLTPFRGYCFQLSYNEKGDCDMGSSPTGDMGAILAHMDERAGKNFLSGQAALAVQAFIPDCHRGRSVWVSSFSYRYWSPEYVGLTHDDDLKNWCDFIDQSYDWIKA